MVALKWSYDGAQGGPRVHYAAHDAPLGRRSPVGQHDVHGRKGDTAADSLADPHDDHDAVVETRGYRHQQRARHVYGDGEEHDPFGAVEFGHFGAGYLGDQVSPEVGAQCESLDGAVPRKRAVL